MTVHARRIASIPRRTATETWRSICELVTDYGTEARQELEAITGIVSALITEEYTRGTPITVSGNGPQVRVYTLHGDDAIDADPLDEAPLSQNPTERDWRLSIPCGEDDLEEATQATSRSAHVEIRPLVESTAASTQAAAEPRFRPVIDLTALEQS